jgi:hypothetical protein
MKNGSEVQIPTGLFKSQLGFEPFLLVQLNFKSAVTLFVFIVISDSSLSVAMKEVNGAAAALENKTKQILVLKGMI